MSGATARPWYAVRHSDGVMSVQTKPEGAGGLVAQCGQGLTAEEDAALIVKAVDSHDSHVELFGELLRDFQPEHIDSTSASGDLGTRIKAALEEARK